MSVVPMTTRSPRDIRESLSGSLTRNLSSNLDISCWTPSPLATTHHVIGVFSGQHQSYRTHQESTTPC